MKIKIASELVISSESNGTMKTYMLADNVSTSGAKSASVYVLVHSADADTDIDIVYRHTAQPPNFIAGSAALYSGTAVSPGMDVSSSTTDVTRFDAMQLGVDIQQGTPATTVNAIISVWLILEPF
jgi:hypothetical protein